MLNPTLTLVAVLMGAPVDVDTALADLPCIADNGADVISLTGETRVTETSASHITVIWVQDPEEPAMLLATTGPVAPPPVAPPPDRARARTGVVRGYNADGGAAFAVWVELTADVVQILAAEALRASVQADAHHPSHKVEHRPSSSSSKGGEHASRGDRAVTSKPRQRP